MNLSGLLTLPRRRLMMWRTGLGFGVHSPFAFEFIRNVLRNPHRFYAFRKEITEADQRLLFRVVNHFNPVVVALIGAETDSARRVIACCCPRARFVSDPGGADFIYLAPGAAVPAEFRVLYAADLAEPPADAMTFSNGRTCVAVRRPTLPPQSFRLTF